jgi:hypothetical protein
LATCSNFEVLQAVRLYGAGASYREVGRQLNCGPSAARDRVLRGARILIYASGLTDEEVLGVTNDRWRSFLTGLYLDFSSAPDIAKFNGLTNDEVMRAVAFRSAGTSAALAERKAFRAREDHRAMN